MLCRGSRCLPYLISAVSSSNLLQPPNLVATDCIVDMFGYRIRCIVFLVVVVVLVYILRLDACSIYSHRLNIEKATTCVGAQVPQGLKV